MQWLSDMFNPRFIFKVNIPGGEEVLINYRRLWTQAVLGVSSVSIVPLVILTLLNHSQYRRALTIETSSQVNRLVSNTKRSVEFFLEERTAALDFIVHDYDYSQLANQEQLDELFSHLSRSFRGFVDLGVIDDQGFQVAYIGPYDLRGRNYSSQEWFERVRNRGLYVSDVFRGFRDVPHFSIAARHDLPDGGFYVLRATIDAARLGDLLPSLEPASERDAFIINRESVLQTDSLHHGSTLDRLTISLPGGGADRVANEVTGDDGDQTIMGQVNIAESPFILIVTQPPPTMLRAWWRIRGTLVGILVTSAVAILVVILAVVNTLVGRVYHADVRRSVALHKIEHTNKMASIGRLAAGVAHEINNPLAIINEKAGLLRDLFTFSDRYSPDDKVVKTVDSIIQSVERCSAITHRLLGFAKHIDVEPSPLDLENLLREVVALLGKEAEYRGLLITMTADTQVPKVTSDKGQLQQVFLNIINNAFAAVEDDGRIDIDIKRADEKHLAVRISDNGCGIPRVNLDRIFEPFFTTKGEQGTGLGLSITYGLVQKLGGKVKVESNVGVGTTFTVVLPINSPEPTTRKTNGGET